MDELIADLPEPLRQLCLKIQDLCQSGSEYRQLLDTDRDRAILKIASSLNAPTETVETGEIEYALKPVTILNLVQEGIVALDKIQAIMGHAVATEWTKKLLDLSVSQGGITSPMPDEVEKIILLGIYLQQITPAEGQAIRDRINLEKIIAADADKTPTARRYLEKPETQIKSWAQIHFNEPINGSHVSLALSRLRLN